MPTISIEGKICFYQDTGKGYPILLGHSYLWDSNMWEPQLKALSKDFRCIAIDLWDHGNSGRLNQKTYSIESLSNDHWQLMEHLKIDQFSIVGLSVGGMWGAHMALNHPKNVQSLVLMDTYLGNEPLMTKFKYFALLDKIEKEKHFSNTLLDLVVPLFFSPHTLIHKKHLVENFRQALVSTKEENIPGIVALGRAIFSRECFLDRLSLIEQPTLVIVGQDDIPRPPKEAREMAGRLPNGALQIIQQAGHISNLEQPEQVTELLANFLMNRVN